MVHRSLRSQLSLAALLLVISRAAVAADCINATFLGTDADTEDAVSAQLKAELKLPIYRGDGPSSCRSLTIEMADTTSRISLGQGTILETSVHLDDFPTHLWPRAIALSTAGLLMRAQIQDDAPGPKSADTAASEQVPEQTVPTEQSSPPAPKRPVREDRESERDIQPEASEAHLPIWASLLLGTRLMPKISVGVIDFAAGIGLLITDIYFDLTLLGVWGKTSVNSGNIITTGVGFRGAVFWQGIKRSHTAMGLGPAVEVLGVYGYGHGNDGIVSHRGWSPVVNVLLLVSGRFQLTRRMLMSVLFGGGYSAVYFEMKRDGETVSGFSGACVNVGVGISFGPLKPAP